MATELRPGSRPAFPTKCCCRRPERHVLLSQDTHSSQASQDAADHKGPCKALCSRGVPINGALEGNNGNAVSGSQGIAVVCDGGLQRRENGTTSTLRLLARSLGS
jgi:hypothetical protein